MSFGVRLAESWVYVPLTTTTSKKHVISLYHDPVTGVRSAMLDFEEIPDSYGNSSLFMGVNGHRIFFSVESRNAYIEIKRTGLAGFLYRCVVDNTIVSEACKQRVIPEQLMFKAVIESLTYTREEVGDSEITWYAIHTTRLKDNLTTTVHRSVIILDCPFHLFAEFSCYITRRFKEFTDLDTQLKMFFKGKELPPLPRKAIKGLVDHRDPAFIEDRRQRLAQFLTALTNEPTVGEFPYVSAFLGFPTQGNVNALFLFDNSLL